MQSLVSADWRGLRDACVGNWGFPRRPRFHQELHKDQGLHKGLSQELQKGLHKRLDQGFHQAANMGSVYKWEMDPTITVVVRGSF